MKDFFILKLLDNFKFIYKKIGVDYKQVRLILQSKLIIDSRKNSKDNNESNSFYKSLIIYTILGLFAAFMLKLNIDGFVRLTIYFTFIMSVIFMAFISEFSSVLLDIKDKNILSTKGIDSKTLNIAKITHILIYIIMLSLAISGFGIMVAFSFGIKFLILFITSIILIDLLMIVFTSLVYSIIIKLFSGEKLKDMINIMQIGISIVFIITYQILGNTMDLFNSNLIYESKLWNVFIIPMWFASTFKVLLSSNINYINIILSIMSIVVPIICFIIYLKNITKFEENLNKLNDNSYKNKTSSKSLTLRMSKLVCNKKEERAFFNFICSILSKDRELKMRTYPSLALSVFLPYMLVITLYKDIDSNIGCLSIYLGLIMIIGFLVIIKYSNNAKAAWIYHIAPIKDSSVIFKGMIKAIVYKVYLPVMILFSIGFIYMFKLIAIKHLIIISLSLILSTIIIIKIEGTLPFSINYTITAMSSNLGRLLLYMVILGIFALIHLTLINSIVFSNIYILILLALINISWNKLLKIDI